MALEFTPPAVTASTSPTAGPATPVEGVLALIDAALRRAYQAVDTALVGLYRLVGESINRKLAAAEWGDGVIDQLAATIARVHPGPRGFSRPNVFRMRRLFGADLLRCEPRRTPSRTRTPPSRRRTPSP